MPRRPPPVPSVPRKPRGWIASILPALVGAVAALAMRPAVGEVIARTVAAIGFLVALIGGCRVLAWRGDVDYYDWYHGAGNPDRPKPPGDGTR